MEIDPTERTRTENCKRLAERDGCKFSKKTPKPTRHMMIGSISKSYQNMIT